MNNTTDKLILKFEILYCGWECDPYGYVYESKDGNRYLVMTNHGRKYIGKTNELRDFIKNYKDAIKNTEKAIELLKAHRDE